MGMSCCSLLFVIDFVLTDVDDSFFSSPDGKETWNVYHATSNSAGACDGNRYTAAQKVNWNSDGTPNFGKAVKLGQSIAGPSGEPV